MREHHDTGGRERGTTPWTEPHGPTGTAQESTEMRTMKNVRTSERMADRTRPRRFRAR